LGCGANLPPFSKQFSTDILQKLSVSNSALAVTFFGGTVFGITAYNVATSKLPTGQILASAAPGTSSSTQDNQDGCGIEASISRWVSRILDTHYQESLPKRLILVRICKTHGYAHTSDKYDQLFTSDTPEHTRPLTEDGVTEALKAGDKIKASMEFNPHCLHLALSA
jgi:hypothetical protein